MSICEGLDIGMDVGSPVDFTYKPPFTFTGKIERVTIDLKPQGGSKPDESDSAVPASEKRPK